jgi:hypothetical protein
MAISRRLSAREPKRTVRRSDDGDVDGTDLPLIFYAESSEEGLAVFATEFGKDGPPNPSLSGSRRKGVLGYEKAQND